MIVHGDWQATATTHRPIVYATLYHPQLPSESLRYTWPFLIDTGADNTLISPKYMELLQVSDDMLGPEVGPVQTLSGEVTFRYLADCTIIFTGPNNAPNIIEGVRVYCPPKPRKVKRVCKALFRCRGAEIMASNRKFPCLLGRDVLQKLSLGYCKTSELLFLSKRHNDYKQALSPIFIPPPPPPPSTSTGTWIDGTRTIDDIAIIDHD
ncbi:MAG: hypothetical protein KAR47_21415 [Planctomycetes bacterium]|nr:hypothetical protein [Planctomycetota bacterium]